jgi:general secretion pathway protein D
MRRILCFLAFLYSGLSGICAQPEALMEVVDLRGLAFRDVCRIFSDLTGLNVVASADAAKVEVSLYLSGVTSREALSALCLAHNLVCRDDPAGRIVRVLTPGEYQRDLSSFREEATRVFKLRYPNAFDVAKSIRNLYGERVRLNLEENDDHSVEDLERRFQRFDVIDGRSSGFGVAEGGGGGSTQGGGGGARAQTGGIVPGGITRNAGQSSGAQRSSPEPSLELSAAQLQALDAGETDSSGQTRNPTVDRRADIFIHVINRLNQVMVRTSDAGTMVQIGELIGRIDVPTESVLLEVNIFSVRLQRGFNSAVDYLFSDGITSVGLSNSIRNGSLAFQYVNQHFRARLQVLEEKGEVRTISTPTLLTANNEVSRLFVGEERPLNRSFSGPPVIVGESTVVSGGSTSVQFRPVGSTLLITPNINADGTVTLRLLQENSNILANGASILVPGREGFTRQEVDTVQSRSVSGTLVARNKVPVVVGGLIDTRMNDTRSQVPGLGNVPLLGVLFGRRDKSKTREELVMMITPHLVDPREGGRSVSREFMERGELQSRDRLRTERAIHRELADQFPAPRSPEVRKALPAGKTTRAGAPASPKSR